MRDIWRSAEPGLVRRRGMSIPLRPPHDADPLALPSSLAELSVEGPDPRTFEALSADGTAAVMLAKGLAPDAEISCGSGST